MTTFKAKNDINSAKELFDERIKFNVEAYEEAGNTLGVVDFDFFEKIRYGHVNTRKMPVIPRDEFMQPIIFSNDASGFIFDFCVFGVETILKHFQDCMRYGNIDQDTVSNIRPIKSYTSPTVEYRRGLKQNFQDFNQHLTNNRLLYKISGLTTYVKRFLDYYKINYHNLRPMTLSKHCISRHASPLETGMAIQFFQTAFDEDQIKYDEIISSPNFPKYVNACRNYGFSIMKHTPNMVIFDINSAANNIPLTENNISSIEQLFETRFTTSPTICTDIMREEMAIGYNQLANENRTLLQAKDCGDKLVYNKKVLSLVGNVNNNIYLNNNILNIYITFKYYEEQERMSLGKFNQIQQNVKYFQKRFDNEAVISYIKEEFQDLYKNEPNNYASFIRRENQKEVEILEAETQAQITGQEIEIETQLIDRSRPTATGRGSY